MIPDLDLGDTISVEWVDGVEDALNVRTGCSVQRSAVLSVVTNTLTSITMDTEDDDPQGFITVPSTTVTVPTGLGGTYSIVALVAYATATIGANYAQININGGTLMFPSSSPQLNNVQSVCVAGLPLTAGSTIVLQTLQNNGGNVNATARLYVTRTGP